jgi:hypothetical protein
MTCPPITFPGGGLAANPALGFTLTLAVMQFFQNWPLISMENNRVCTVDDDEFKNAAAVCLTVSSLYALLLTPG